MDTGNDYVIQVKGNQKNLHNAIKIVIESEGKTDQYKSSEMNRGRKEERTTSVYKIDRELSPFDQWPSLHTVIHVKSHSIRGAKTYKKDRYYISSISNKDAQFYAQGIRSHWYIENKLHWVKDVILNEDNSGIKSGHIAANLSLIKSTVMALFKVNNYNSIKRALEIYANRPKLGYKLLENNHI